MKGGFTVYCVPSGARLILSINRYSRLLSLSMPNSNTLYSSSDKSLVSLGVHTLSKLSDESITASDEICEKGVHILK